MFRPTKKRPKKTRVVTSRDDDDDGSSEEERPAVVKRPKKKKKDKAKRRTPAVAMSFDAEEEVHAPSKRGKKSRGMGYGGAPTGTEEDESNGETNEEPEIDALYDTEALEALKSKQRFRKQTEPKEEAKAAIEEGQNASAEKIPATPLASYISLDTQHEEAQETVILTGEEAMSYGNDSEKNAAALEPSSQLLQSEENTETQAWEAEVVRRAGFKPTTAASVSATAPSLSQLQQQVMSTMSNLQKQQSDLQNAYNRRVADLSQTQTELERQEKELAESGNALEYYQQLRQELASWVGALRELSKKIKPLQQAVVELDVESNDLLRMQEWQDDMIEVLLRANGLESVLGRQVENNTAMEEEKLVDEFGRDVKSQRVLEREKRARQRQLIRQEWQQRHNEDTTVMEESSDAGVSEGEFKERCQRRNALQEALDVAMQELDEEYASLFGLFRVFDEWHRSYPEEYKQCFAALSLADLAGVLIRVDMCSVFHPLHWRDATENTKATQLYWLQELQNANDAMDKDFEEETPIHHVLDKVLVPAVCDLLDNNAYNVFSEKQSQSLASFCSQCFAVSPNSQSVSRLKSRVAQYLRQCLDTVSIPIVKAGCSTVANTFDNDELQEAMAYATKGHVHRLKKLLVNLLRYWVPALSDMLIEPILDFMTSRFLFVLSSLQAQELGDLGSHVFSQVWGAVKETEWMDRPDLMLQAAPLRAAAVAYGQS